MKTEKEIRDEIEAVKRTINGYHESYKQGYVTKERLSYALVENESMLLALKWVLSENNR